MASASKKKALKIGDSLPVDVGVADEGAGASEEAVVPVTDSAIVKDSSPVGLGLKEKKALDARPRYIFSRELFNELREKKMLRDLPMAELTELSDRIGGRQFAADEIIGRVVWDDGEPTCCVRSGMRFQPHASLLIDRFTVSEEGFVKLSSSSRLSVLDGELTVEDLELLSVKRTGKLDGLSVELGNYCVRYSPKKGRWTVIGPLSGSQFFTDQNTGRTYPNKQGCLGEARYALGLEALEKEYPKLMTQVEEELAAELGEVAVAELGNAFTEKVSAKFIQEVKAVHGKFLRLANTYSKEQAEAFVAMMNAQIAEREEKGKTKRVVPSAPRSVAERKLQEEERVRNTRNWLEEMEID